MAKTSHISRLDINSHCSNMRAHQHFITHDERLSEDEPPKQILIGDIVGDKRSPLRSISSLSFDGADDDTNEATSTSKSGRPLQAQRRSIFGVTASKREGQEIPRPMLHRTRSPTAVMEDPYQHFGLEDPNLVKEEEDELDKNEYSAYEHSLRQCEDWTPAGRGGSSPFAASRFASTPLWQMVFGNRSSSAPTLRSSPMTRSHRGLQMPRNVQSESALHPTRLKPSIRVGRFNYAKQSGSDNDNKNSCKVGTNESHVKFQAVIQVHQYERPIESWAAEGWSSWFH